MKFSTPSILQREPNDGTRIYCKTYTCLHSEIPNQYLWLVVSILLISLIFNHRIGMMFIDDPNGNRFIQTMVALMRGHLFLSPQIGCGFGDLDGFGSSFLVLDIHDIRADQLTNSINFQNMLGRPMAWLQHFWLSNSLCFWWCVSSELISKSRPDHQSKELQWNMFLCWGQSWVDIMDYSCPILCSRPVHPRLVHSGSPEYSRVKQTDGFWQLLRCFLSHQVW